MQQAVDKQKLMLLKDVGQNDGAEGGLEFAGDGLVAGGGSRRHEEAVVDDGGEGSAEERAHPVNPVVGEVPSHHGGAEGAARVHGCAAEGRAHEDLGEHGEANGQGRDHAHGSLLGVHGGREHHEHEGECQDDLHQHRRPGRHAQPFRMDRYGLACRHCLQHPRTCIHTTDTTSNTVYRIQSSPNCCETGKTQNYGYPGS